MGRWCSRSKVTCPLRASRSSPGGGRRKRDPSAPSGGGRPRSGQVGASDIGFTRRSAEVGGRPRSGRANPETVRVCVFRLACPLRQAVLAREDGGRERFELGTP